MGAEDIGTWYAFLEIMSTLAVMSNMALFAFTGQQLEHWSWKERVVFFAVMEHFLLALKFLISFVSPLLSPPQMYNVLTVKFETFLFVFILLCCS